jgi:peptidoglycan/xylan/chitin deacetylase (PgdA/CDA1 family)
MSKLTIIYYHEVVEKGQGSSYQKIEKDKFENQMRFLKENGYESLFFSELEKPLPKKAVIVSFDDGFKSVFERAYPIMQKYGIKGNVYLPTAFVGENEHFMTWDMIKELTENGFEMQAHTHNHVDIRTLDSEKMDSEINLSEKVFLDKLNKLPNSICLPFGTYDQKSLKLLKKSKKYKYVLGSFYGQVGKCKLKKGGLLARVGISDLDSIEVFENKLKGKFNWKGPLQRLRLKISSMKGQRIEKYDF